MPPTFQQLLQGFDTDEQIAEDNPFLGMQRGAQTIDQAILRAAQSEPTGIQSIGAGIISGLMGGVSDRLSRGYRSRQQDTVQEALPEIMSGRAISRGEMGPSVFNRLQSLAAAQQMSQRMEAQERAEALKNQQLLKLSPDLGDVLYDERRADALRDQIQLRQTPDYGDLEWKSRERLEHENAMELKGAPTYEDKQTQNPLVEEAIFNLRSGKPLTEEQNRAVARANLPTQRLIQGKEETLAQQDRFEIREKRFEADKKLNGYVNVGEARPTGEVLNKAYESIQANEKVKFAIESLKATGDKAGFMKLVGNDSQIQAAMQAAIFNAWRLRTGSGARLEGPEGKMLAKLTPQVLSGDILGALTAWMLDRDQMDFANTMQEYLDDERDVSLGSVGFISKARTPGWYPEDIRKKFGLPNIQPEAPAQGVPGVPQNTLQGLPPGARVLNIREVGGG